MYTFLGNKRILFYLEDYCIKVLKGKLEIKKWFHEEGFILLKKTAMKP